MGIVLVQELFLNIVLPIHMALIKISINLDITQLMVPCSKNVFSSKENHLHLI